MIDTLIAPLAEALDALPFVDRAYGLVRPLQYRVGDTTLTVPVACGHHVDDCMAGKYSLLLPNDRFGCVLFFEQSGTVNVQTGALRQEMRRYDRYTASVRLLGWASLPRLGVGPCGLDDLVTAILQALCEHPGHLSRSNGHFDANSPTNPGLTVEVRVDGILPATRSLFSAYTLNIETLYPMEAFGLQLTLTGLAPCRPTFSANPVLCP